MIEDNGGGLTLAVFDKNDNVEYLHSGYEQRKGQLTEDLQALKDGDNPVTDWEGNEDDPQAVYDNIVSYEYEWEVVVDNDGIYYDKMGSSAHYEFGYGKDIFEEMIADWQADNAPEYDDLEITEIKRTESGWVAMAKDEKTQYEISDDGTGNIVINYLGNI